MGRCDLEAHADCISRASISGCQTHRIMIEIHGTLKESLT